MDDEGTYTGLMSQMLESNFDCRVSAFTRPLDALAALPLLVPAVIVTDYFMPQLDGLEFIRQAAALAPQAAFILITGHSLAADDVERSRAHRLRGYLPKPFGWRRLAEEIIRVWPHHLPAPAPR